MERFTSNAMTVALRDVGSGPTVLMLHNGGTSSTIWRNQIDDLSRDHRVLAVDLPGFGDSPRPQVPPTLDSMIGLLVDLLDQHGEGPSLLVGNCMGANLSLRIARARPDLVRGVLAVNPLTEATFRSGGIGFTHSMSRVAPAPARLVRSLSRRVPVLKRPRWPPSASNSGARVPAWGFTATPSCWPANDVPIRCRRW